MLDLLIKNGVIVNQDDTIKGSVAIKDGKIVDIYDKDCQLLSKNVIDASGQYILPGIIDPHVHIKHPYKGGYSADDFYTATKSAAFGGTTTVIDFAIQWDKNKTLPETLEFRKNEFAGNAVIDYGLHICSTRSTADNISCFQELLDAGAPSFKMYMTYSKQGRMSGDGILYDALKKTADLGGIVGVHAENDSMILYNFDRFTKAGKINAKFFPLAKENIVESEAVNRAIYLNSFAKGNLYIFHLSTRESLELVKNAQRLGQHVTAETCAHYLALDDSYYDREDGYKFICSPPLRSKTDSEALWRGIQDGIISTVSSDHCGFSNEQKLFGNKEFPTTPNGLPGMELLLPLVYTKGVETEKITINQLVAVLSTNTAKTFGMFPQKGIIAPGSDADLVILDSKRHIVVSPNLMHSPVDWSPYEGMSLSGFPTATISRGEVIVKDNKFLGKRGRGNFIPRKISAF